MQNYSTESKSQLAKLLATENITVQHAKIQTASFNLKTRVLNCPIWTDMSGDLYDLLMGHEVGHALETPEEGWHDAIIESQSKNFKTFLNVVEDARIEKKIKRRYPGLKKSFINAYKQLIDKDFFGIKNQNVNTLPFIDKINLYTKGGTSLGITFTDTETELLGKVEKCETWEDVVRVAEELFGYSKKEQQDKQENTFSNFTNEFGSHEGFDSDISDDLDFDDSEDGKEETTTIPSNEQSEEDGKNEEDGNTPNRFKESKGSMADQYDPDFEPICETDQNFRNNEASLLDEKCKEYIYVNIPTANPKGIFTSAKRVHEFLTPKVFEPLNYNPETELREFKNKNDRYISLLAKEFEMRKAAKSFAKKKISNTGDIDINSIYKYKLDDNIFRKMMQLPKGKSHGLVLLLDRSGSMSYNMAASLEQILILSMFCKKVNIPFVVYGFGNDITGRMYDTGNGSCKEQSFIKNDNDIAFEEVFLREYLNSSMSSSEYLKCVKNILMLKKVYQNGKEYILPKSEGLSNTPLTESMVALRDPVNEFRKRHNLDLVNLCIVHDGDADWTNRYVQGDSSKRFCAITQNVIIQDKKTKYQKKMDNNHSLRAVIFDWFSKTTNTKIFGFYITKKPSRSFFLSDYRYEGGFDVSDMAKKLNPESQWHQRDEMLDKLIKDMKKDNFVISYNTGYDAFYIIRGGNDALIGNEELKIEGDFTAGKLKTAFSKLNKAKQSNRVLATRFIERIAA